MLEKLKENNYQIPIIIAIIIFLLFAFIQKPNTSKIIDSKTDSISTYYQEKVNSLDSVHKSTVEALKSHQKSIREESERELSVKETQIHNLNKTISNYKQELNRSKSQFIYIEDGEVKFNDFFAKGKKVVYKKGELESIIKENNKTTELKNTITKLNSLSSELSKRIEIYRTESSVFVSVIDSLNRDVTDKSEQIVELSKESHTEEKSETYNISFGSNGMFDTELSTDMYLDIKKYLLTIPIVKSKLYVNLGYVNENVMNLYLGHKAKAGIGVEF